MHEDSHNVLILVRSAPHSAAIQQARRAVQKARLGFRHEVVVFFHGDAVAEAASGRIADWTGEEQAGPVRLMVCRAAWQRRFDQAVAPGFELSSLVQFWQLAIDADQVLAFGARHGD